MVALAEQTQTHLLEEVKKRGVDKVAVALLVQALELVSAAVTLLDPALKADVEEETSDDEGCPHTNQQVFTTFSHRQVWCRDCETWIEGVGGGDDGTGA